MSLLDDAFGAAVDAMSTAAREPATYSVAASDTTFAIQPWRGRTDATGPTEYSDSEGQHVDWLLPISELAVEGSRIRPNRSDRITDANGVIYEVLPITEGETSWEYSSNQLYRIHTKIRLTESEDED